MHDMRHALGTVIPDCQQNCGLLVSPKVCVTHAARICYARADIREDVMKRLLVLGILGGMLACSSGSNVSKEDAFDGLDLAVDVTAIVDVVLLPEVILPVGKDIAPDFVGLEVSPDVPLLGCQPGEGCFLDECTSNASCQSGWCVEHLGDGVCTKTCQDECPAGWTCQQVAGTEPDVVFICVSDYANLCKPCASTGDCGTVGKQDVCLDYGDEGSFCGGTCTTDDDCPWGFSCDEATTADGATSLQCVNDTGSCPCTAKSIALSLATPCTITNDSGTCAGHRICTDEGLADCDATVPAAEECNGIDDNCNGLTDEATCDDGLQCTLDTCVPETGCTHEPLENGECTDGNPCTVADHCVAGVCGGAPVACDDSNPCTDDSCDETGGCIFTANQADCDDDDPCTLGDHCKDATCVGAPVECACQSDADCDGLEDGDVCNGTLVCDTSKVPYVCTVSEETVVACPLPTGPDAFCLAAVCHPETGACSLTPDHQGFACDDGDSCTIGETCQEGTCTGGAALNCNDGNVCTDDSCDDVAGCLHENNEKGCQDGNICTVNDSCLDGQCVAGKPLGCNDNNECTDDSCSPETGCLFAPNNNNCNDANPCTSGDHCQAGKCLPTVMLDCDDENPCTDDTCDANQGCIHALNSAPCDDGNACTLQDHCKSGWCAGTLVACDDGNVCTDDSCNEETGCQNIPNQKPCTDATICTIGDHCQDGICQPTATLDCDDGNPCTDDACNPDLGCVHKNNSAACDDGDGCTTGDQCTQGNCQGGLPVACDDGVDCTEDVCVSPAGCESIPKDLACDDGNVCTDDLCDPEVGCVHSLNQAPCEDGDPCSSNDACNAGLCEGGEMTICDDGNICTQGSCQGNQGCVYVPVAGECDDGDSCTTNDSCQLGQCLGAPANCDDEVPCTVDDCTAEAGCQHTPDHDLCNDNNVCTENTCDADAGCITTLVDGDCDGGSCVAGECVPDCVPQCAGKACGADGCDGTCGTCGAGFSCSGGKCLETGSNECNDGNDIWWDGCTNGKLSEFQVNTFTPGDQHYPDVAGLSNGRVAIVWASYDQDGSKYGIYGQLFDTDGSAFGDEFQVNQYTSEDQTRPRVAALGMGTFVVVWDSINQDGNGWGTVGRRYKADGTPDGAEFILNSTTSSHQYQVAVAGQANGHFMAGWQGNSDGSSYGIFQRLFDAQNSGQYGDSLVNSYTANAQYEPDLASLPEGYVAVWHSSSQDSSGYGIYGQRFALDGSKTGSEFKVHTYTPNDQERPSVSGFGDGGFVAVWDSNAEDGSNWGVYCQRFAPDGSKVKTPFRVNTYIESTQYYSDVATWSDGRFVVVWASHQDGDGYGIYGQRYNSDGTPAGNEFQVNVYTKYTQYFPAVATIPGEGFIVAWYSQAQDDSVSGVFAQRYDAAGNKLYH